MNEKDIMEIFDSCLEEMKQGKSLDEVIKDYPKYKEKLKDLLSIAMNINDSSLPEVKDDQIASCLIRVGEELNKQKSHGFKFEFPEISLPRFNLFPKFAYSRAVYISLFIIIFSLGTLNLSAYSMPGEILYPLKLMTEKAQFIVSINPEQKAELRLTFSEKRMKELVKRINSKGELDVETLKLMLGEVDSALIDVENISSNEKEVYLSRVKFLNDHHKEMLEKLKSKVRTEDLDAVNKAIDICRNRMHWMGQMERGEMPHVKRWGKNCMWH